MAWTVKIDAIALKQLKKMDVSVSKKILNYIRNNLEGIDDPRTLGTALLGDKSGFWRYRVLNYRLICELVDSTITINILRLGHRKDIYNTRS